MANRKIWAPFEMTMYLQLQRIITKGCLPVFSFFLVFYSDVKFVRIFTAKHQKDNQNTVYLVIFHDYLIFTFLRYHLNCKLLNTQFCIIFNKKFIKSQKKNDLHKLKRLHIFHIFANFVTCKKTWTYSIYMCKIYCKNWSTGLVTQHKHIFNLKGKELSNKCFQVYKCFFFHMTKTAA